MIFVKLAYSKKVAKSGIGNLEIVATGIDDREMTNLKLAILELTCFGIGELGNWQKAIIIGNG